MNNKKKCFVIMPFSRTYKLDKGQWTEIFEHKIKAAVEECGLDYMCERYEFRRANITKDILQELNSAHIVIADLTGNNPNVLWELGIRHTLSKRTILIAQDKKFLPSDLKDYPIITYKYKQTPAEVNKFRQEIKDKLEDIEGDPDKPDSPVADFLGLKNLDILAYEKSANLKKLSALISELSENIENADVLLKQANEGQKRRKEGDAGPLGTPVRFSNSCLQLLVSTQYVLLPEKLSNYIRFVNEQILLINSNLELRPQFGEGVDDLLVRQLPKTKEHFTNLLQAINQVRLDYLNNNYQEPKTPTIILASTKHEKYIKLLG